MIELKEEYVNLLNEFFNIEVEDREIVLDDLDKDNGFLYKLMCEWYSKEFVVENDLGLCWYEYSLEDLFRDTFGISDSNIWRQPASNISKDAPMPPKAYPISSKAP